MPFKPGDLVIHKSDKKRVMVVAHQATKIKPTRNMHDELANTGAVPDGSYYCTWTQGAKKGEGYFMEVELDPPPGLEDFGLLTALLEKADKSFDGHLTVMKFTTNWRVSFTTPSDRDYIDDMSIGKTFPEAAQRALDKADE